MALKGNGRVSTYGDPGTEVRAATPSDTVDLTQLPSTNWPRALYIGVSGDVTLVGSDDATANGATDTTLKQTFKSVPVGFLPVSCRRIMATGTTATNILAIY
jgi:hypothetical protein